MVVRKQLSYIYIYIHDNNIRYLKGRNYCGI